LAAAGARAGVWAAPWCGAGVPGAAGAAPLPGPLAPLPLGRVDMVSPGLSKSISSSPSPLEPLPLISYSRCAPAPGADRALGEGGQPWGPCACEPWLGGAPAGFCSAQEGGRTLASLSLGLPVVLALAAGGARAPCSTAGVASESAQCRDGAEAAERRLGLESG